MVKLIKSIEAMRKLADAIKRKGCSIGFVPTMGYLHEGHLSLVKEAKKKNDYVVVSIFVNPIQFGPKEDLKKYPSDIKRDLKLLSRYKVDAAFCPDASEMYPKGYKTYIEVKDLSDKLCGRSRPGHFMGVATIVMKLFNIVEPDIAYFGKKDFQQQVIIKKMVRDLNMNVKIISMPTIREKNGLAMSSRNSYLSRSESEKALVINKALKYVRSLIRSGVRSTAKIRGVMTKLIRTAKGMKIDYISISDPQDLEGKKTIKGKTLIAIAVHIGKTRLIDNILI